MGKAPVDVIDRAVAFAASHDLGLLWIDQEVTDPEDATAKSQGIQVMDIGYERSLWPIAILDTTIVSQDQFDVLDPFLEMQALVKEVIKKLKRTMKMWKMKVWKMKI